MRGRDASQIDLTAVEARRALRKAKRLVGIVKPKGRYAPASERAELDRQLYLANRGPGEEFTYDAIAAYVGLSRAAVATGISRARIVSDAIASSV